MPELPEIEHLRRSLEQHLLGCRVDRVQLKRRDILRHPAGRVSVNQALLCGHRIEQLQRHGKQLAIISSSGGVLCVHLGMSGQILAVPAGKRPTKTSHIHCRWRVSRDMPTSCQGELIFRDPRRFGGLWAFRSMEELIASRWAALGPDALTVRPRHLAAALASTSRPVKVALLDQRVIAGVGNIYADEALHFAGIHPFKVASELDEAAVKRLASAIRRVLREAIRAGGTTIRDYADGNGQRGRHAARLAAYGRAGEPCRRCHANLLRSVLVQRSTVYCPRCQPSDSHPQSQLHGEQGS